MRKVCCVMAALAFSMTAHAAFAAGTGELESDFRCGTELVSNMDQDFQVLQKCGEPQSREKVSGRDGPLMEKWVYGPSEGYYTVLTFRDGVLVMIKQTAADE